MSAGAEAIVEMYRRMGYTIAPDGSVIDHNGAVVDRVPYDLLSHVEKTQHETQDEETREALDRKRQAAGEHEGN